jgi:small subunit ribosomal protein S9
MAKEQQITSVGRRKTSVARALLKKGKGSVIVNNQDLEEYQNNPLLRMKVRDPLILSGEEGKWDIRIRVFGGGASSQIDAIRQAIARALLETGSKAEELKKAFLSYDRSLLVSDTRFKEMKKPNNSSARAKRQKSYR